LQKVRGVGGGKEKIFPDGEDEPGNVNEIKRDSLL